MKKCSDCGAICLDEETVCGVCGTSFPDFFGQKNGSTPLEPVRHWRITRRGALGLSPGILLLVSGIGVALLALAIPVSYPAINVYTRYAVWVPVTVESVLFLVGMVTAILGALILSGELQSLRQVEWKRDVQKQETGVSFVPRAIKSLILLAVGLCLLPSGWFLFASNPGPTGSGLAGLFAFMLAFIMIGAGLSSVTTGARFGNRGLKTNSPNKEGPSPVAVYQQTELQVRQEKEAMEGKPKDEQHPPAT